MLTGRRLRPRDAKNRDVVLGKLVLHFSKVDLKNASLSEPDMLGRAYEYLIEKFADDAGKTAIAYGVGGVPETFFLDANGKIGAKHSGPITSELLQANLQKVTGP